MKSLFLVLLALPLCAQSIRYRHGDDPRWADLNFNDTAWGEAVHGEIPAPPFAGDGYLWMRQRISVDSAASGPLAIRISQNIASLAMPSETWVNGTRVASVGVFPPAFVILNRPVTLVFDLPPGLVPSGGIAVVAKRYWVPPAFRNSPLRDSIEFGPRELLTLRESQTLSSYWFEHIPEWSLYAMQIFCGLLLLAAWRVASGIPGDEIDDLLWLGAYLTVGGVLIFMDDFAPAGTSLRVLAALDAARFVVTGVLFTLFLRSVFSMRQRWPFVFCALANGAGWLVLALGKASSEPNHVWFEWRLLHWQSCFLISNSILIGIGLWQALGLAEKREAGARSLGLALAIGWAAVTAENYGLTPVLPFSVFSVTQALLLGAMGGWLLNRSWKAFRAKQEIEGELDAARLVQASLLASTQANSPHFAVEAVCQPSKQVGGDFYWCSPVSQDGSLIVVVGDVSGKGLKAAMTVSVAMGILSVEKSKSPAAILANMNDGLSGRTPGFVTCCCARFDSSGQVTVANAGHPAPYADGREVQLEAGLPLGLMREIVYEESVVQGDRFTFVSDGVVEAENTQRELFGFERTRDISTKSAREIAEAAKAWGQTDDITVVTVRRRNA